MPAFSDLKDVLMLDFEGWDVFQDSREFLDFARRRIVGLDVFGPDGIREFRARIPQARRICVATDKPGRFPDVIDNSVADVSGLGQSEILKRIRYVL